MKHSTFPRKLATLLPVLALCSALVLGAAPAARAQGPAPSCDITGATTLPFGQTFNLCGIEGTGLTYSWYDNNMVLLTHDRCVSISGLAVGEYDYEFVISQGAAFLKCPVHLVVTAPAPTLVCPTVPQVCGGNTFQLCGQDGPDLTYSWSGDGISGTLHDRCVTVGPLAPGDYVVHFVVSFQAPTGPFLKCDLPIHVDACQVNCPRTVGFWSQQCAQKGNGSTKFTVSQMTQITDCVDAHSAAFNWGAASFSGFCGVINPTLPMDIKKQAKRQFAGLLANLCTGSLALVTSNGEHITLSIDTPISCGALNVNTIGEFIARADSILAANESKSLSDPGVQAAYSAVEGCADSFNNGVGIGPTCAGELIPRDSGSGVLAPTVDETAVRISPNPFRDNTTLRYAVQNVGGDVVELGVYDLAGRLVKKLASGFQASGSYQLSWDGQDESGARVRTGVYFVRGTVGQKAIASRLLVIR